MASANTRPTRITSSGPWNEVVVEALPVAIEEDDPVGLCDRPDDPADDRHWTEHLNRERPHRSPLNTQLRVVARDVGHDL